MIKRKAKSTRKANFTNVVEKVVDVDLLRFARKNYYEYGTAVLEDRAIPDYRDGMLPVNRRALWSCYDMGIRSNSKFVKSARVVGDTMGRFHPHGDTSLYSAVVGMTSTFSSVPLLETSGNWGSFSDERVAAMRYTEMRLSAFSDQVLFNKFYTPVVDLSPNYDGSIKEPVLLPALLPIILLNGREGIAPGASTYIPTFTEASVIDTLALVYGGEEITPKLLYRTLRFKTIYGGVEQKPESKEQAQARMDVFKTTKGRVVMRSTSSWDEKSRTLTVTKFARVSKVEKLLGELLRIDGVTEARDDSTKHDEYGTLTIILKRGLQPKQQAIILKTIETKVLSSPENFILNFTERYKGDDGKAGAKMKPMDLTSMLIAWVKWRIELERLACTFWIDDADKRIHKLDLLILAVDNRKIIIESLDKDCSQQELDNWLAKKLKITPEEASFIYDLKVKQLRKLEKSELLLQKKDVESKRLELKRRHKTPEPFMLKQLDEFKPLVNLTVKKSKTKP